MTLEAENRALEVELASITKQTQELMKRQKQLSIENKELERESKLRNDLIRIRLSKILAAEERQVHAKLKQSRQMELQQQSTMNTVLRNRGLTYLMKPLPGLQEANLPTCNMSWLDDFDNEYI